MRIANKDSGVRAPARRLGHVARIAAIGVGLVIIYAAVLFVANAQLGQLLPAAIAEAVGGHDADRYTVQIGKVRLSPSLTGLTVEDLVVVYDSAAVEAITEPALVRSAALGRVRLSGVSVIPLLLGQGIFVSSVEIDEPEIALDFSSSLAEGPQLSVDEGEASGAESDEFEPPEARG